jgi:two-component system response regulator YesN
MYRILIVDDEVHAVEGICSGIDWNKLGISEVYKAYTVRQAKELFETKQIDIMLCDIEMPQATGLELTEWVREHYPKTETIFLTCHADFSYAKQALQLGSLDYLLKPVPFAELEKVILKAQDKIVQNSEIMKHSQSWLRHQPLLIERFWLDILNQIVPSHPKAIYRAASDRSIPYFEEMQFIPILISIQRWHKAINLRDEKVLEYGLRNSAEEMILTAGREGLIFTLSSKRMLAILSIDRFQDELTGLEGACQRFIEACNQYFYCDISCYMGDKVQGHDMLGMVNKLLELERNNVAFNNKVFLLSKSLTHSRSYKSADMNVWSLMLKEGAYDDVSLEASRYLNELRKEMLNAEFLQSFFQNFQQMIHFVLHTKGIQAYQLFNDTNSIELDIHATRSVTHLLDWVNHVLKKSKEFVLSLEQSQSVVEKVLQFISLHLSEDLSREEIASHVFLNPDYLTRIFKKETGLAISDYLFQERLKLAKELLAKTDMPIGTIASHIGYVNFSYFSRMFKKQTNLNPNEYRQLHQQK